MRLDVCFGTHRVAPGDTSGPAGCRDPRIPGVRDVVGASYVNLTAVLALLRPALGGGRDIAIICVIDRKYGDNLMRLFLASAHGRALRGAGFADDLLAWGTVDAFGVVPVYADRQISTIGPEREG